MKHYIKIAKRSSLFKIALFALLVFCVWLFPTLFETQNTGGRYALNAFAAGTDVMSIDDYDIRMTVGKDRKIQVEETIVMTPYISERYFTRSLPTEGKDRYYDISASCLKTDGYTFNYFVENDSEGDYLSVVCEIPFLAQQTRIYNIQYTMEIGADDVKNGMRLDVVGFGWGVALKDVDVTLELPAAVATYEIWAGGYGVSNGSNDVDIVWEDETTLKLHADELEVVYNNTYQEKMAKGITVEFTLPEGTLADFESTRTFTNLLWIYVLVGVLCVGLAVVALVFLRKKRELFTVVNITAPDGMDPMKMGKLLDGTVDAEDVTSMIFYFAYKGYLDIDLSNENDPVLIRKFVSLPAGATVHERTLFAGLFASGAIVHTSALKYKFYRYVDKAKMQVPSVKMYDKKSVFGFVSGSLLGVLFAFLTGLFTALCKVGGGYTYFSGILLAVPVLAVAAIGYLRHTRRYKWKKSVLTAMTIVQVVVALLFSLFYIVACGRNLLTESEKFVVCAFTFACTFLTLGALSRSEQYNETLGQILGFKEFIVVTEEDKIKFMLEQDPTLYYKILPYAQVLGVTDEWENKFKNILVEPPQWCTGNSYRTFNYLYFNACMRRAMITAMSRPQETRGGSFTGRSGGGGSFGGFGGGGHGGGGGRLGR